MHALLPAAVVAGLALLASHDARGDAFGKPRPGVYECTLPGVGLFTGAYFGIVDGGTYRNFDGKRGSYSYEAASGTLRLTSGAGKGLAYRRQSETTFRVLDDKGKVTGGNCVLNKAKSIDGRW